MLEEMVYFVIRCLCSFILYHKLKSGALCQPMQLTDVQESSRKESAIRTLGEEKDVGILMQSFNGSMRGFAQQWIPTALPLPHLFLSYMYYKREGPCIAKHCTGQRVCTASHYPVLPFQVLCSRTSSGESLPRRHWTLAFLANSQ